MFPKKIPGARDFSDHVTCLVEEKYFVLFSCPSQTRLAMAGGGRAGSSLTELDKKPSSPGY